MSDIKILVNDFKAYLTKQDMSTNTILNYLADINNFAVWYDKNYGNEIEVKEITASHLIFFRDYMIDAKRFKTSTINRKIQTLRRFFSYLADNGIIKANPSAKTRFVRRMKLTQPNSLNKHEITCLTFDCISFCSWLK